MRRPQPFPFQPFTDQPTGFRGGIGGIAGGQRFERVRNLKRESSRPVSRMAVAGARLLLSTHAAIFENGSRHGNHQIEPYMQIIGNSGPEINRKIYLGKSGNSYCFL